MPVYNTNPPQKRKTSTQGGGIDFNKIRANIAAKKVSSNSEPMVWPTEQPQEVKQGILSRINDYIKPGGTLSNNAAAVPGKLGQDYMTGAQNIIDSISAAGRGEQSPLSAGLQTAGEVAKAAFAPINRLLEPVLNAAADPLSSSPTFSKIANSGAGDAVVNTMDSAIGGYDKWAKENPELSKNIESGVNIGLLLAGEKPAQTALQGASDAITTDINAGIRGVASARDTLGATKDAVGNVVNDIPGTIQKGKDLIKPPKDIPGTVGEITQAKDARGLTRSEVALRDIATKDAPLPSTYEELATRAKTEVKNLANQVDETLAQDTTKYKPKDLTITETSNGGQPIKIDWVSRALNHLEEIYASTGNDVAAANVKETIAQYVKEGLTKLDINNLARVYGREAPNAFSKLGDALTSRTAQASEAIRSGLKDVARSGMDSTAQNLDAMITNYKSLEGYSLKMQEAVQALTNKVEQRGILERAGRALGQVADFTTGGFAKAFFNKFLITSNVGLKTLNSLDLEAKLLKNLELIGKISNTTSDAELLKTLETSVQTAAPKPVPQIKAPQFEQRSSIQRSPIIKYIKDNPPNIGLSIRDVKSVDSLTKKEMIDIIDYARLKPDYNQSLEDAMGYLAEKYHLKGKTPAEIANELEVLVRDTKTTEVKAPTGAKKPASKPDKTVKPSKTTSKAKTSK